MASSSPSETAFPRPLGDVRVPASPPQALTLDSVRDVLIRLEDTIVFCLIERARHPYNSPTYEPSFFAGRGDASSLVEFFVKQTEAVDAKVGRYQNPEEVPFFSEDLPEPLITPYNYPQVLHPASASANVNKDIWEMYFNELLPLLTVKGDDGNYGSTAASDLVCLQALSRRIHYGKFVAEVKFLDAPQDYRPAILAQDRDALMKLVTFESVEESVKRRVAKKAMVFGQDISLNEEYNMSNDGNGKPKCKVDPEVVARLYGEWVMPLTKLVQVEYLLRRLD